MTRVRQSNDLIHWVRFFLSGVAETAAKGRDTFRKILALRTEMERQVLEFGKRTPNAQRMLDLLYRNPVITAADLRAELEISQPTANALLSDFERLGILHEITGRRRSQIFVFQTYLDLYLI